MFLFLSVPPAGWMSENIHWGFAATTIFLIGILATGSYWVIRTLVSVLHANTEANVELKGAVRENRKASENQTEVLKELCREVRVK